MFAFFSALVGLRQTANRKALHFYESFSSDIFISPSTRYVGNTMATFVMQSMGCEVAALNTVHFSERLPFLSDLDTLKQLLTMIQSTGNHAGYRQLKGTKATAEEISSLYEGLRQSYLADFDVLLSGYAPSAAAVEAVGEIAADLKKRCEKMPGSFFWGVFTMEPFFFGHSLYLSSEFCCGKWCMLQCSWL